MIKSYILTAIRHLLKHKTFSAINIVGLSVGLAACLLISLYVLDELRYDRFNVNADRIYRVSREWFNKDGVTSLHLGFLAPSFAPLMKQDFPEQIEKIGRFVDDNPLMVYQDKKFNEPRYFYAERSLFDIFTWPLAQGDLNAFSEPNTLIITQSTARKYFGSADAVGKVIRNQDEGVDLKVVAVAEDIPSNTHIKWDMLCSFATLEVLAGNDYFVNNFGNNSFGTYVLLNKGAEPETLESLFPDFIDRWVVYKSLSPGQKVSQFTKLHLWPVTSIHLYSHLDSEVEANGDIKLVYIYIAVAGFILLIACINFMNLSTARASDRSKEVGIRKVVGADRATLIRQFVSETSVVVSAALVLAIGLVELILPWFNGFTGKSMEFSVVGDWQILGVMISVAVIAGIGAGSYPAFYLSAFKPVEVLKGVLRTNRREIWFRGSLVVFQFAISIAMIVCVGMIRKQLDFMQSKTLGFDRNHIVSTNISSDLIGRLTNIRERLLSNSAIESVTFSSRVPSGRLLDSQGAAAEIDGEMKKFDVRIADIHVDHDFLKTYRIQLAAGRDFDIQLASDSTDAFILNEAAVSSIGWRSPEEAVGKKFNYGNRNGRIIGVVRDFHFESLHQKIAPIVFLIPTTRIRALSVRFRPGSEESGLKFLAEEWDKWKPGYPFDYSFIDDRFLVQYRSEEKLGEIIGYFAGLAVLVASLGLFALATFSAQKRTKEIGIRKVLGAGIPRLVLMLSRDFTKFVVIANILAWPAAYFASRAWLELFPYHVGIDWLLFVFAGLSALGIALATVSYHAVKTASSNPVQALKYE